MNTLQPDDNLASDVQMTSTDYYINKFPNKITDVVFDLEKLARNFSLDNEMIDGKYITTGEFASLQYSQKLGKGSIELLINKPPIGPINPGFMCTFCEEYGPNYHSVICPNPDKRSLVLTYAGFKDLIKDPEYDGPLIDDVRSYRIGNKLEILKKYFEEFIEREVVNGKTVIRIPNDAISEIIYDDVIKTKGKDPQAPKTLTVRYSNIVSIFWTLGDKTTNVRVYKDGSIDIKNLPQDEETKSKFLSQLVEKINNTNSVNKEVFNRLLRKNGERPMNKYDINFKYSYYYLFHSQFYMFGKENRKQQEIDFENLELLIEPEESNQFITVKDDQYVLNMNDYDATIISKDKLQKEKKILKDVIDSKVYIIMIDDTKISVFITKYGVFQITLSSDILNLNEAGTILDKIRLYFIEIFSNTTLINKTYIVDTPMIYSMNETQDTTVSGLVPPKSNSQRSGTEVCRKTQAGVLLQPRPYSWTGTCPAENYAPAIGIDNKYKGGDVKTVYNGKEQQLYYPCCEKITGFARNKYIDRLRKGFTHEEQERYGIFPDRDILSGILVPDSTKIGAISEVLIDNDAEYTTVKVVGLPERISEDAIYDVERMSDSKIFRVPRKNFKRDSRYFRGLDSLSKSELVKILKMTNSLTYGTKTDIDINSLNQMLSMKYITKDVLLYVFTKQSYKLSYVPDSTFPVYLQYNNKDNQFYINTNNRTKIKSSIKFIEGTTTFGYYNENDKIFYPIYVNGYSDILENENIIIKNMVGKSDTVSYPELYDDIIETSNYVLKTISNTRLLFIPTNLRSVFYYYDEQLVSPSTVVQIIERLGGSRYVFGYDNIPFEDKSHQVLISSTVSEKSYIKVVGNYDKITKDIDRLKPFTFIKKTERQDMTFEKASMKYMDIFNPVNIIFFTENDGENLVIDNNILTFNEDTKLLDVNPM